MSSAARKIEKAKQWADEQARMDQQRALRAERSFWQRIEDATSNNEDLRDILHELAERAGLEP